MRHVMLAALVGLGSAAFAGEPAEIPRVRVPGESPVLAISESLLVGLGMIDDDVKTVKKEAERLNGERAALFDAVKTARDKLQEAQGEVDKAVAALARQEKDLDAFIAKHLPMDRQAEYAARKQLQPVIDWLKLKDDQVSQLMTKQKELADSERAARADMEDKLKALQALAAPKEPAEHKEYATVRKAYYEALKKCAAVNQTWLANIESVLTDEQKQVWRTRYRRTASPLDLGAPAPAGNE
ncbi:MAG TPA: hypothetical protein VNE39_03385 [Planctomycetota bacterium]|nr:hypothetical protein [Planctomycetota bacterium]